MSKELSEYGDQKSCRITTCKRLKELLGDEVIKEKGLNCKYIVSKYPGKIINLNI
jgi:DNA polymerase epsilon subunit 1